MKVKATHAPVLQTGSKGNIIVNNLSYFTLQKLIFTSILTLFNLFSHIQRRHGHKTDLSSGQNFKMYLLNLLIQHSHISTQIHYGEYR